MAHRLLLLGGDGVVAILLLGQLFVVLLLVGGQIFPRITDEAGDGSALGRNALLGPLHFSDVGREEHVVSRLVPLALLRLLRWLVVGHLLLVAFLVGLGLLLIVGFLLLREVLPQRPGRGDEGGRRDALEASVDIVRLEGFLVLLGQTTESLLDEDVVGRQGPGGRFAVLALALVLLLPLADEALELEDLLGETSDLLVLALELRVQGKFELGLGVGLGLLDEVLPLLVGSQIGWSVGVGVGVVISGGDYFLFVVGHDSFRLIA